MTHRCHSGFRVIQSNEQQDVFADRDGYKTVLEKGVLRVNTQEYRVLIVPYMEYGTQAFAPAAGELEVMGMPENDFEYGWDHKKFKD